MRDGVSQLDATVLAVVAIAKLKDNLASLCDAQPKAVATVNAAARKAPSWTARGPIGASAAACACACVALAACSGISTRPSLDAAQALSTQRAAEIVGSADRRIAAPPLKATVAVIQPFDDPACVGGEPAA